MGLFLAIAMVICVIFCVKFLGEKDEQQRVVNSSRQVHSHNSSNQNKSKYNLPHSERKR